MPNHHRHMHRSADDEEVVGLEERAPEAVTRTVYMTLAPTFNGEVGGYTTVKSIAKPTEGQKKDPVTSAAKPATSTPVTKKVVTTAAATPKTSSDDDNTTKVTKVTPKTTSTPDSTSMPSAISRMPTDSDDLESVLATASDEPTLTTPVSKALPTEAATTPALASSAATSNAAASKSEDGSSAGTKAGIAFGVLGGLLVVGLLVFFLFNRRRKRAQHDRQAIDDEKLNGPIGSHDNTMMAAETMSVRTNPQAPRVSLRPVTQFLPNWNLDKRASKDAGVALTPTSAAAVAPAAMAATSRAPGGSAWDRPTTSQSIDAANPFGNQAERVPSPIQEESIHAKSSPPSPGNVSPVSSFSDPMTANGPPVAAGTAVAAVAVGAAAGAGAAVALTRKTSMRNQGPKNLDLTLPKPPLSTVPPSPAGTEFSVNSMAPGAPAPPSAGAAAIAAAGGPANSAVHRVQLDFKPTLEDELELRAGDLVRLLHEYDDGWAQVIRLDRSQQGVVPRTCLSTRPVKPRPAQGPRPGPPVKPNGPPRGSNFPAGQRPMTPQGPPQQGRPASPAGPMTPNGGRPQSPMGRPMSPAGPRNGPPRAMSPGPPPQSPGPRPQGGRPQSPNGMGRRPSPPGPSPMNPAQGPRPGPPTGPVGRKPVPGQAY